MANILFVDDDVDLVSMNCLVLRHRGHNVVAAYSAEEARRKLDECSFDVAVLDVMMESVAAGFDLARDVHQKFPDMPMIIVSGVHAATGVPFRFAPDENWLPVKQFLDKPVDPVQLAARIEDLVKDKTAGTDERR